MSRQRDSATVATDAGPKSIVHRPFLARVRRGGTIGLALGGLFGLIEAVFANWDTGMAFNPFDPLGTPLGPTLATTILAPVIVGATGGALAPLFRTRRGAILAGVCTFLPLALAILLFSPARGSAVWQLALVVAGGFVLATSMAVDLRPLVLDSEDEAVDADHDRPHN
jgi:uncharacterized membrane protein